MKGGLFSLLCLAPLTCVGCAAGQPRVVIEALKGRGPIEGKVSGKDVLTGGAVGTGVGVITKQAGGNTGVSWGVGAAAGLLSGAISSGVQKAKNEELYEAACVAVRECLHRFADNIRPAEGFGEGGGHQVKAILRNPPRVRIEFYGKRTRPDAWETIHWENFYDLMPEGFDPDRYFHPGHEVVHPGQHSGT